MNTYVEGANVELQVALIEPHIVQLHVQSMVQIQFQSKTSQFNISFFSLLHMFFCGNKKRNNITNKCRIGILDLQIISKSNDCSNCQNLCTEA